MATSGLTRFIANGLQFALTKASTTTVGLKGPTSNPATSFSLTLPSALPGAASLISVDAAGAMTYQVPVNTVFGRTGTVVANTNDYTASQIAGLGGSAGVLAITPSSTQTVTAAVAITPNAGVIPISSASVITITTSNPQITAGVNGQVLSLINVGTNSVTLGNGRGLQLSSASLTLATGQAITLVYSTALALWLVNGSTSNSLALPGTPTAVTALSGANTTQLATTAFVQQSRRPLVIVSRTLTLNATATYTDLAFNNVIRDASTAYNPTTGVFTAPYTGFYAFSILASDFSGSAVWVLVSVGSANVEQERIALQWANAGWHVCTGRVVVYLTAGQTRTYGIQSNVTVAITTEANFTARTSCHASIEYLGTDV